MKLTLRMEERLIGKAKMHGKQSGKLVSRLVADFFALLGQASETDNSKISPKVRSLKGLLKSSTIADHSVIEGALEVKISDF